MKNLLEYLLIHLVQHPEEVTIDESENERGMVYTVHVHPEDIGRIIGKNGSVIQSIRTICKIRAIKEGIRATVVVADNDGPNKATAPNETAE